MARGQYYCAECEAVVYFEAWNRADADRKTAWYMRQGSLCWTCRSKENLRHGEAIGEQNKALGLPELKGSIKQIAWAETIRNKIVLHVRAMIKQIEREITDFTVSNRLTGDKDIRTVREIAKLEYQLLKKREVSEGRRYIDALQFLIESQTSAHWWIENKSSDILSLNTLLRDDIKHLLSDDNIVIPEETEAKEEATLRPAEPVSSSVIEIRADNNTLTLTTETGIPGLKDLLRAYGIKWVKGGEYARTLAPQTGDITDRIAEIAHHLIASGYIVRVYDTDAHAKAFSGQFTPEHTRWIRYSNQTDKTGWLQIQWGNADDYHGIAKTLPGAKYVRGQSHSIFVPPSHYAAVEEFAQQHDFRFTEKARSIAEAQRAALQAGQIIKNPRPLPDPVVIRETPPIPVLHPEHTEINPDLLDD